MAIRTWMGDWLGKQPVGDVHQRSRQIVRSTGGIVRGKFPSRKNGRMIHHEGLLELDAIYLFEASKNIERYREQPATIRYPDGAKLRRYTPDFEITLKSGGVVLIEIKPQRSLESRNVQQTLRSVQQHLERSSQSFEIITDAVLRVEPRQANVRAIYHRAAKEQRSFEALSRCANHFPPDLPLSMEQVHTLLQGSGVTPYCLLLAGILRCDHSSPLQCTSQLNFSEDVNHDDLLSTKRLGF
jgi:hypothetical protein